MRKLLGFRFELGHMRIYYFLGLVWFEYDAVLLKSHFIFFGVRWYYLRSMKTFFGAFYFKFFVFAILGSFSSLSLAQDLQKDCYKKEVNPVTHHYFVSIQELIRTQENWRAIEPAMPNPVLLLRAYSVFKFEEPLAKKMKNDKVAHCYMGCRLSQETDYRTADYVGWLKEERDIHDCDGRSHFDPEDYQATLRGALGGENHPEPGLCRVLCNNAQYNTKPLFPVQHL